MLLLSLRLYSHLEALLSKFNILSCTNSKKNGRAGDSEADRSSSKHHKTHENGPNSPKLPSKDLESQISNSSQPLAKCLILTFFHQSFLSRDAYDRALGRDVIKGGSKLTSQRHFASVRGRVQCIASIIASSTVGGSLGPFDRNKPCQTITRAPGYLHSSKRPSSLLRLLFSLPLFASFIHRTSYPTRAYIFTLRPCW